MIAIRFNKWIPLGGTLDQGHWEEGFHNHGFFSHWTSVGGGPVVGVIQDSLGYTHNIPKNQISFLSPAQDWEVMRYELAKEAMGAFMANNEWIKTLQIPDDFDEFKTRVCASAIEFADEMIMQLQKPKP